MKNHLIILFSLLLFFSGCSTHFHLDFLGQERLEEVVLLKSPVKEKLLVIDVEGFIGTFNSPGNLQREKDMIAKVYARLQKAAEDHNVRGIILRLDTPGGEVTASDIIYNEILRFKKRTGKPVVALMMATAASGGYYIASACDAIIAHPSTITGSIGVISIFPNVEDLLSKVGVQVTIIKSGEMKDSGSSFHPLTEEAKAMFQRIVDEHYNKFLDTVEKGRSSKITRVKLEEIADGRIFTAPEAQNLGLVDEIGYFNIAFQEVMKLAGISAAEVIAYTYYPKQKTNLYSSRLSSSVLIVNQQLEEIIPFLKSGFYYLWLPQALH